MRGYSVFLLVASLLMFSPARSGCAQTTEFDKVKVRFNRSEKDRRMVDKDARLIFDDASRKLIVEAKERPLEVGYDEIQKVIFERTTHARGRARNDCRWTGRCRHLRQACNRLLVPADDQRARRNWGMSRPLLNLVG